MLLTVTRLVAADGLDPVPPCEGKAAAKQSLCLPWADGGLQSLAAADKKDTRRSCHLKSPIRCKAPEATARFYEKEDKHADTHAMPSLHV